MSSAKKTTPRKTKTKSRSPATPTPPKNVRSTTKRTSTKKQRSASVSGRSRSARTLTKPKDKKTPKGSGSSSKARGRPRTKTYGSGAMALTPDAARHRSSSSLGDSDRKLTRSSSTKKLISSEAWSSVLSPSAAGGLSDSGASLSRKRMFVASPDLLAKASTSKAVAYTTDDEDIDGDGSGDSAGDFFAYPGSEVNLEHEDSDSSYNSDDSDMDIPDYSQADQALNSMFYSLSATRLTSAKDTGPNMMELHRSAAKKRKKPASALILHTAGSGSSSSSSSIDSVDSALDIVLDDPPIANPDALDDKPAALTAADSESGIKTGGKKKKGKKKGDRVSAKPSKLKKLTIDTSSKSSRTEPQSPVVFGKSKRRSTKSKTPSTSTPTGRSRSTSRPKSPMVFGTPTPKVRKKPQRKTDKKGTSGSGAGSKTPQTGRKQTRKGRSATITNPQAFRMRSSPTAPRTPKTPKTPSGRSRRATTKAPATPNLTHQRTSSKSKVKSPKKKPSQKKKKKNAWLSKLTADDLMVQHVLRDIFVFAVIKREEALAAAAAEKAKLAAIEAEQKRKQEAEEAEAKEKADAEDGGAPTAEAEPASEPTASVEKQGDDEVSEAKDGDDAEKECDSKQDDAKSVDAIQQTDDEMEEPVPSPPPQTPSVIPDSGEDSKEETLAISVTPDPESSDTPDQCLDSVSPRSPGSTIPDDSTVLYRAATTSDIIVLTPVKSDSPKSSKSASKKKSSNQTVSSPKKKGKSGKKSKKKKGSDALRIENEEPTDHSNEKIVRMIMIYHLEMQKICVLPPLNVFSRVVEFEKALFGILKKSKRRDFDDLTVSYPLIWDGSMGFPPGATFENTDYYYSVRVSHAIMHEFKIYTKAKLTKQQSKFFLNEVKDYYGKCLSECNHEEMNYQE